MNAPVGVLLMAHGTPSSTEEIAPFYARIRRGRPPTDGQLADLIRRYDAIGGLSPLTARTAEQVGALRRTLASRRGGPYAVAFGAKHTAPFIEDGAALLQQAGVRGVVGLVLTPHDSGPGTGDYLARAEAAVDGACPFRAVRHWYDQPAFVSVLADRLLAAHERLASDGHTGARTVFTAHSLPAHIIAEGDPYLAEVHASAALVAQVAGITDWQVAWQSAGRTAEPWLEPDVRDALRTLAADGRPAAVVCPIGFVADHLEVLYDIDIELAAVAAEVGVALARTESLNDDPRFIGALADVATRAARDL
jgi:ferrochelatase